MRKALTLAALLFAVVPASAQVPNPPPQPPGTPVLSGFVTVSVTATTGRAALPSACPAACAITVSNFGTKDAFVALGGSTVVATTSSTPVRSGKAIVLWIGTNTYIAAIAGGTDTTSLDVYQGNGPVVP